MAGETQLLELRRQYHCAAYNCAIAVIGCSFNEPKFYHGFLFSEKPEKVTSSLYKSVLLYCCMFHTQEDLTGFVSVCFLIQNQVILENIINVDRIYNFPIEIEVCLWLFNSVL